MTTVELRRTPVEGALVGWLLELPPTVARLPVGVLSAAEKAAELGRLQARRAMDAAYEAELVMGPAADRPDTDDPPPGHPGARRRGPGSPVPGTSEFLPDELAAVLNCSRPFATGVLSDAYVLVERMPAVRAAARPASWTGSAPGCSPACSATPRTRSSRSGGASRPRRGRGSGCTRPATVSPP